MDDQTHALPASRQDSGTPRVQVFTVHGRVTERASTRALPGLRVEVRPRDGADGASVGAGTTGADGRFQVQLDARFAGGEGEPGPELVLRVFRGDQEVRSNAGLVRWRAGDEAELPLEVDLAPPPPPLTVGALVEVAGSLHPGAAAARATAPGDADAVADHAFWKALRDDPEVDAAAEERLRSAARLLEVAGGSVPAAREMAALAAREGSAARALAGLDADGWRELAGRALEGDPAGADALAERLRRAAEEAFPTAHLARSLARAPEVDRDAARRLLANGSERIAADDAALLDALRREARVFPGFDPAAALEEAASTGRLRNPVRERVAGILDAAPELDLAATPVDEILRDEGREAAATRGKGQEVRREDLAGALRRLQRVVQVAPRHAQVEALLDAGLDSAVAVSGMGRQAFVRELAGPLGGEEEAARVHEKARQVTATATQLFASVYQAANDVAPRALGGSEAGEALTRRLPDWATLFGRLELCDCPHCRSVYSPAAYLVDLLQFLNPPAGVRPLAPLLQRRPDLEHIQLTCENTNTALPYVDLVNEVLESYIALGVPRANDTTGSASADALSVHREYGPKFPEAVSESAYQALRGAVFPFSLPFDRHLETVRAYLQHLGSSRWEVLDALRAGGEARGSGAESLRLPYGVAEIYTGPTLPLRAYYGYEVDTLDGPGVRGEYFPNPDLAGPPQVVRIDAAVHFHWRDAAPAPAFGDLFSVRWTGRITAPHTGTYTFHTVADDGVRLWVGGNLLIDKWGAPSESSATAQLTAGESYDLRMEYCDRAWLARAELSWTVPTQPRAVIAPRYFHCTQSWQEHLSHVPELLKRTGLSFQELLDLLGTRFLNPDPASPRVRLETYAEPSDLAAAWLRGLGADGDAPLRDLHRFVRLWRALGIPMRDLDAAIAALGRDPAPFLERLAAAMRVREALERHFGARASLAEVLSLWAPLDTHGTGSPYETLFRNRAVFSPLDPDFELVDGEVAGTGARLDDKRALLSAALRLGHAELAAARDDAGLGAPAATLSLAALSAIHRRAVLARALRVTVAELAVLKVLTGTDPFASPADAEELLERAREVRDSGFTVAQLAYLFRDEASPTSGLRPQAAAWTALLRTVRAGLARIEAETAPGPDPDAVRLRALLALEIGEADASVALAVIDGTSTLSPGQQAGFVYNRLGFLPAAVRSALLQPLGPDAAASREARRTLVRDALLRRRRDAESRAMVTQAVASSLDLDLGVASLLLEEVLRAGNDPNRPAMHDFLSLTGPGTGDGLLGTYFSDPDLANPVFTRIDPRIDFSWGAGAPDPSLGDDFSIRWTGKVLAAHSETYTFHTSIDDGVRLWVDGRLIVDQWLSRDGALSGTAALQAGQLHDIRLEFRESWGHAHVILSWSSPSTPYQVIPQAHLFSSDDSGSLAPAHRTWLRMHKTALLVGQLRLTSDELRHAASHPTDFAGLDLNLFPVQRTPAAVEVAEHFTRWRRLREVAAVQRALPASDTTLLDVFRLARTPESELAPVLDALADATGWDRADLGAAASQDALALAVGDFRNAAALPRLQAVLDLARRVGAPVERLVEWAGAAPDAAQAAAVRDAVKARYDEEAWVRAAAPIAEGLRDRQRNALVTHLLQRPEIRAAGITDANRLFEHFLIDVQMGTCMKTSRIRQAIASVQLFVQRCLLNLEVDVPPDTIDADQWAWMKNYRVWEANRKVFLYPENWIEPELRDDKTPFFRELETDLLQSAVTEEVVADAYLSYLEKLDAVSRLEILGLYRETTQGRPETLHVFGRSYAVPHIYYYRRRVGEAWTAWEKVDADVSGDHLVPVVFSGRLFLFWPEFEQVTDPADNPPDAPAGVPPKYRWDVRMAWSEYRQGKWTGKKVYGEAMRTWPWGQLGNLLADRRRIFVRASGYADVLFRRLLLDVMVWKAGQNEDGTAYVSASGQLLLADGRNVDRVYGPAGEFYLHAPPKSQFANNTYEAVAPGSQLPAPLALPLRAPTWSSSNPDPRQVLGAAPSQWRVVTLQGNLGIAMESNDPFFYQDKERTYHVTTSGGPTSPLLRFHIHFHPHARHFTAILNGSGIPGLLALETQRLERSWFGTNWFQQQYAPTAYVDAARYPAENVDFDYGAAYGVYNWELFFHAPVFIADRLSKEQRFAEAQRWFHYVFNPINDFTEPAPQRYWRFLPFHLSTEEQRIEKLLQALADPDGDPVLKEKMQQQIADWREHPFEPHRIARMRLAAYQKSVVMKYIDNLIAWGDHLFAQDTAESVGEATQLYVLAANILGPRPERVPEMAVPAPKTYAELKGSLDEFSNVLVDVQNRFPFVAAVPGSPGSAVSSGGAAGLGLGRALYFGIPRNDKLLQYWDRVEDRLFKIRHCMNIEGVSRTLALFEPPIDPALLVRARAAGVDLGSALSDLSAPLGHYRFGYLLPRAVELCAEVRSLGGALLSALEKRDAEALSALRQRHDTSMLALVRQVREQQVAEAKTALEGLRKTRLVTEARQRYYESLEYVNPREREHLQRLDKAQKFQVASQIAELAVAVQALLPNAVVGASGISSPVVTFQWGGANLSGALQGFSRAMSFLASLETYQANRAALLGGWDRRRDEWQFQRDTAGRELDQIDRQIAGAEIRVAIAERELANHDRQVANAEETERFLRDKFTSEELYAWLATQVSALYFQAYQLAYAAAKRAERAYRFERGLTDSGYVRFGHWDSLRKGLLAGERLHLDLKRLEMAHLEQNAREHELTRHLSLAVHDPLALIALKETGRCHVELPEALFDLDHPGHYMRRMKSVSLTIPCVTGPYTGVNARLTLLSSRIRVSNSAAAPYEEQPDDPRFLVDFSASQSIATSHAQNDPGLFELSFRDERYLPFEGAGAVSTWRIELPKETNPFDFDTITDVVLKLSYTAREGGELLRRAALEAAVLPPPADQPGAPAAGTLPAQENLQRVFSARHEFTDEWRRFLNPAATSTSQRLPLRLTPERFPYRFRGRPVEMRTADVFLKLRDGTVFPEGGTPIRLFLRPPETPVDVPPSEADPHGMLAPDDALGGILHAQVDVAASSRGFGDWTFEVVGDDLAGVDPALVASVTVDGVTYRRLRPEAVEDLAVVYGYATG